MNELKTLWKLKSFEKGKIVKFGDNLNEEYQSRLKDLGFHLGEIVECVHISGLGAPKVYRVHNSVYALDDVIAKDVYCE